MLKIIIDEDAWLDICNIDSGVFAPLKGFLNKEDYESVIENMHLKDGTPWTIPITLSVAEEVAMKLKPHDRCELMMGMNDEVLATIDVEDVYTVNYRNDIKKVYGVDTNQHPGVLKEISRSPYRVGGAVTLKVKHPKDFPYYYLPEETKKIFKENGFQTVVGFQTRNPIHRAHEHLQRIGLEVTDGLFVQPLVGWKRSGDFTSEAVLAGYEAMVHSFYPPKRVQLGTLRTAMRYAGPREAVFHAIIRKNYGCTHFIVGRDHAGVGNYYGMYEAQNLCAQFNNLGIQIMALGGPFYCRKCLGIATEKTCSHAESRIEISGTIIRKMLSEGLHPPEEMMRKEVAEALIKLRATGRLFY